jgi:hypothetical protein
MKKYASLFAALILLITLPTVFTGCSKDDNKPATLINTSSDGVTTFNNTLLSQQLNTLPKEPLSPDETESILLMREEEKMARDAYINFYQKWNQPIFTNISQAEQTHMDAVLLLVNKYSLTDPVGTNPVGVFINSDIQSLYNNFIAQGNLSYAEALKAGAVIEEVDIRDLQNQLNNDDIDNQDIELVYTNLLKGSRNHLRSFVKVMKNLGITYAPQYLSLADYNAIIAGQMETGRP